MGYWNVAFDRRLSKIGKMALCAAGFAVSGAFGSPADLNGDSMVNDRDVVEWYRAFYGQASIQAAQLTRYDLNSDGQLSGHDLSVFARHMEWNAYRQLNWGALMTEASTLGWYDVRADFNNDGRNDQEDVVIWLTALVAPQSLPAAVVQAADVNRDGELSGHDLTVLIRAMGETGRSLDVSMLRQQVQTANRPNVPGSSGASGIGASAGSADSSPKRSEGGVTRSGGQGTSPSSAGPVVIPGGGPGPGTGIEPVAAPVSSGAGSDAKAIARWDVVPFQVISGEMNIGVVAFHVNEIDRVEFSANGGAWVSTSELRHNPHTGVREYWATLRASDFADGVVEVRAVAYPRRGVARTLDPVRLYANSRGTLEQRIRWARVNGNDSTGDGSQSRPFRTIYRAMQSLSDSGGSSGADHGLVLLGAGEYEYKRPNGSAAPKTTNAWVTVQPGPGVSRDSVSIVSSSNGSANGGMATKLVHLRNVTMRGNVETPTPMEDYLWLEDVAIVGQGPLDPLMYSDGSWWTGMYATGCELKNVVNGFVGAHLIRNVSVDRFYNDAFPGCVLVINATVKNGNGGIGPNGYEYHSDVWQERNPTTSENVILYGIVATENCSQQGIFSRNDSHRDMAIVNCSFNLTGYPDQSQWRTRTHHMVIDRCTFLGAPLCLGLSDVHPSVSGILGSRNTVVRNSVFQWVNLDDPQRITGAGYPTYEAIRSSVQFDNNHFINLWPTGSGTVSGQGIWCAQPMGTNATTGPTVRTGIGAYGNNAPPPSQQ